MKIYRKKIWSLTWPVIIANLTIPLVGLTDTIIMGHMPNSVYIAAIALGGLIFNFIYAGLNFFRMGTTGIVAQKLGEKNSEEVLLSFLRPLILSLIIGFLLILVKRIIFEFSIYILNPENIIENYLKEYFYIRIIGIPAGLVNLVFLGWFFGLQKSKSVMLQIIIINSTNIFFSFYLSVILKQGIYGVALGSVLAQLSGLIISILIFFKHYKSLNFNLLVFKNIFLFTPILKLFNISKDLFLRTISLLIAKVFIFKKAITIGVNELATIEILIVIFSISSSILDAFAHTAETTVGNAIGSKNRSKLKKSIIYSSEIALVFSILISLALYIFKEEIIFLITDINILRTLLSNIWFLVVLTPIVSVLAFQLDGIFIGATLTKEMRDSMILSGILFYVLLEFVVKESLNIENLYSCFLFFLFSRGVILSFYFHKIFNLTTIKT
tara:strand:+ start:1365 stop:2684 length:1320 start_codon:yes stop_codon:yes gene_type:complete